MRDAVRKLGDSFLVNWAATCLLAFALVVLEICPAQSQNLECLQNIQQQSDVAREYWYQAYREKDPVVQCPLFRNAQEIYRQIAELSRMCGNPVGAIQFEGMARRMREAATGACSETGEDE